MDRVALHRVTIRPGHLEQGLDLWRRQVELHHRHGLHTWRGFVETDAEPKLSWVFGTPDGESPELALAALEQDEENLRLREQQRAHLFGNLVVRQVEPLVLTEATAESMRGCRVDERIAIMRRYHLTGDWDGFLALWEPVRQVRERYGFRCLLALADRPHDLFTWAFDFDGDFADFPAAQRDYYHDPERVALRGVFDHMADYSIHPARQLPVPTH